MAAFGRWTVGDGCWGRWTVVSRAQASPAERERALPAHAARWAIDQLFARLDDVDPHVLFELADVPAFDARHHARERLKGLIEQRVGPPGPLLVLDERRGFALGRAQQPHLEAADAEQGSGARATRDISLRFIEAGTGRPVAGAALTLTAPDGTESRLKTSPAGLVTLAGLDPGRCVATSIIENATAAASFAPDAASSAPRSGWSGTSGAGAGAPPVPRAWLVQPDTHRVRTGDTMESIARAAGAPWADLARFNWETTDPARVQSCLRDRVGCTKRTPDGQRYVFDDRDDPGVILIPRPWTGSFAVGMAHTVVVTPLRSVYLSLENESGARIPGAAYEVVLADGRRLPGRLGRSGIARLSGVPEGPFSVSYVDQRDLLARSLAASTRRAFDQQATGPLFYLLGQEQAVIDRAVEFYDEYFDDLTGRGLAADIDQAVTDPDARPPLIFLCALAGLRIEATGG